MNNEKDEVREELWTALLDLTNKYQDRFSPSEFIYLNMCFLTEIAFKCAPNHTAAVCALLAMLNTTIESQRNEEQTDD